ncbi:MAG: signal peptidase I [Candidatus Dormibacteraeota bacterium]|uniref:Signal peptidase I n=1 Tax=Candidatus Amunia macphersoniae TaxID=3127014 RepID=A0A934KJV1_9BACT|nr:signal peptidase I [Candidatus Dormibacteraeota bacterium]
MTTTASSFYILGAPATVPAAAVAAATPVPAVRLVRSTVAFGASLPVAAPSPGRGVAGAVRHGANLAAAALAAVLVLFMSATAFGVITRHHSEQVITGSMVPTIPIGSLVITEKVGVSSLHQGDILVFAKPTNATEVVVHRIAQISTASDGSVQIHTKGDANRVQDPWVITQSSHGLADRATYIVPAAGTAIAVGRSVLVVLLPSLLIVGLVAWARRQFLSMVRSED